MQGEDGSCDGGKYTEWHGNTEGKQRLSWLERKTFKRTFLTYIYFKRESVMLALCQPCLLNNDPSIISSVYLYYGNN